MCTLLKISRIFDHSAWNSNLRLASSPWARWFGHLLPKLLPREAWQQHKTCFCHARANPYFWHSCVCFHKVAFTLKWQPLCCVKDSYWVSHAGLFSELLSDRLTTLGKVENICNNRSTYFGCIPKFLCAFPPDFFFFFGVVNLWNGPFCHIVYSLSCHSAFS